MRQQRMMRWVILTATLVAAAVARAGVFYVDQGNAKAADTNPDTREAPSNLPDRPLP